MLNKNKAGKIFYGLNILQRNNTVKMNGNM